MSLVTTGSCAGPLSLELSLSYMGNIEFVKNWSYSLIICVLFCVYIILPFKKKKISKASIAGKKI